ncbi:hypothetical protein PY650_26970 [Rhizobium calliandrae]|uniref:Uncharacterized protein n=1 Tax=Rhizobium calliandrae TaxID=1312182 RepID=A0ABT7KKP6_9HYPH|nr:hypothetical protein [Rhizobium calliandrae]MDL2409212.1 hypothetical protein [Rhizobium calliandrae]
MPALPIRGEDHTADRSQFLKAEAATSRGRKHVVNEDAFRLNLNAGQFVIADGMDGQRSGRVKLIDFNIACPQARTSRLGEEDTVRILGRLGAAIPIDAPPQCLIGAEPAKATTSIPLAL